MAQQRNTNIQTRSWGARVWDIVWGIIISVSAGATVASFALGGGNVTESLTDGFGVFIACAIIANGVMSIISLVGLYKRSASMTGNEAFKYAAGATLSIILDVVALILALTGDRNSFKYYYISATLAADTIIDFITHMKRS